jgi:dihydropteroate synthase
MKNWKVCSAIHAIHARFPQAIISIDTFHSAVAAGAVDAGASIVNDVSGGSIDNSMLTTVGSLKVPYVCMHMKGIPATMQLQPTYDNLVADMLDFFIHKINECRMAGIEDIIIDPGFGFGKTIRHNFELLQKLRVFSMLEKPVLLGISRKSTIYKTLGITASEALNGSTVLHTIGLMNGADILRVHDVKEAVEAVKLVNEYRRE